MESMRRRGAAIPFGRGTKRGRGGRRGLGAPRPAARLAAHPPRSPVVAPSSPHGEAGRAIDRREGAGATCGRRRRARPVGWLCRTTQLSQASIVDVVRRHEHPSKISASPTSQNGDSYASATVMFTERAPRTSAARPPMGFSENPPWTCDLWEAHKDRRRSAVQPPRARLPSSSSRRRVSQPPPAGA